MGTGAGAAWPRARAGESNSTHARRFGRANAVGVHGGNSGSAGQRHAERFGDRGHGGSRAHDGAGAGRRDEALEWFHRTVGIDGDEITDAEERIFDDRDLALAWLKAQVE